MPTIEVADSVELAIGSGFSSISNVTYVLTERVNGSLSVWIAVDDSATSVRELIYQKELDLVSAFSEIDFEFNLVSSMNRQPAEIASNAIVAYARRS